MTAKVIPLNAATTAGPKLLSDSLTTVEGAAAPLEAEAQVMKMAFGAQNQAEFVSQANPLPVKQVYPIFWRVGFAESGVGLQSMAASELTPVQTGAGMTVSQSGGNLLITTGTTVNSETVIRSNLRFKGSLIARYKATLSQRIANQSFRFELADFIGSSLAYTINSSTSVTVAFPTTNPYTVANVGQSLRLSVLSSVGIAGRYAIASVSGLSVTFTVAGWPASGSGTLTLYGLNWLASTYDGTTATASSFDCQRRGWASGNTTAAINTTASPGHVGQINFDVLAAGFADSLVASNTGYQWANRASRIENIPDEDVEMHFFLVVQNGSTAPASSTTLTVGFIQVEDQGRHKVRIASADPVASHPQPVQIMNPVTTVGVTGLPTAAALADAFANPTATQLAMLGLLWNNATWDRARGNTALSVEASSVKAASGNSAAAIVNHNARGVQLVINVSAFAGTSPTLVVNVQVQDPVSSAWVTIPGASTATITGNGQTLLTVYPGATPVANSVVSQPLGRNWRLAWTIGGTASPSFTFSVGALYVL